MTALQPSSLTSSYGAALTMSARARSASREREPIRCGFIDVLDAEPKRLRSTLSTGVQCAQHARHEYKHCYLAV